MKELIVALALIVNALPLRAEGERAGAFDYYVLSLSWSPSWCDGRTEGPQCGRSLGWILHGLWPQFERGWPSYCPTREWNPSRRETSAMADIMGSSGNAWHQWKKHGVCTGLSSDDFYALSREAYGRITRPALLRRLTDDVRLPASVIEDAFLAENPALNADMITITCKQGYIEEVRLCLSRDLEPVPCGRDVIRDCTAKDALFDPIR